MSFKNSKFVKKLEDIAPRIKWAMFRSKQGYKNSTECIGFITPKEGSCIEEDNAKLEAAVKESLVKEFGHVIQKSKSYGLLVDAVVHNLKKKQLEQLDIDELDI